MMFLHLMRPKMLVGTLTSSMPGMWYSVTSKCGAGTVVNSSQKGFFRQTTSTIVPGLWIYVVDIWNLMKVLLSTILLFIWAGMTKHKIWYTVFLFRSFIRIIRNRKWVFAANTLTFNDLVQRTSLFVDYISNPIRCKLFLKWTKYENDRFWKFFRGVHVFKRFTVFFLSVYKLIFL